MKTSAIENKMTTSTTETILLEGTKTSTKEIISIIKTKTIQIIETKADSKIIIGRIEVEVIVVIVTLGTMIKTTVVEILQMMAV